MIENIFANIGLSHHPDSVASHGTALPNTPTILEFESDFKEGWTFITISEPGRDALDQIESRLDASRTRVTPLTVLLLPLDNRRTPELCEAAEKLGFFSQALVQVKKAV